MKPVTHKKNLFRFSTEDGIETILYPDPAPELTKEGLAAIVRFLLATHLTENGFPLQELREIELRTYTEMPIYESR